MSTLRVHAGGARHTRGEHSLGFDQALGPDAEALVRAILERAGDPKGETICEVEIDEGGAMIRGFVRDHLGHVMVRNGEIVRYERRIR